MEWIDRWMDGKMYVYMYELDDGMLGQMNRRKGGQIDEWLDELVYG